MELKPCPFCGGESALGTCTIRRDRNSDGDIGTFTGHSVNCINCGVTNRGIAEGFKTPERAAEHWNRRAPEAGKVAVPREPTDEMIWAMCSHSEARAANGLRCNKCPAIVNTPYGQGEQGCRLVIKEQYKAMLAASEER